MGLFSLPINTMKTIISTLCCALFIKSCVAGPNYIRVYSKHNQNGQYADSSEYVPSLAGNRFDNNIASACLSGIWLFYDNYEYNLNKGGKVYWMHGIDFCGDLPREYSDMTSSFKYSGDPNIFNENAFTLYSGKIFTGNEFWSNRDVPNLDYMSNDASSLIITGLSPWTFFTGYNYGGNSFCVYPNSDHDQAQNGVTLDIGFVPHMSMAIPDNSIRSARKGCWSKNIARSMKLDSTKEDPNGAMGVLEF